MAIILPPKIYHYEPKIFGFKIAGKRGSEYFKPPTGNVKYIEDSVQGLEMEEIMKRGAAGVTIDFGKKMHLNNDQAAAKGAAGSTGEDNDAVLLNGADSSRNGQGKKNRKKNKKWL